MGTELRDALKPIKDRLRITKVVCTRSVKGKNGDVYVGFSASWDTIQDDAGGAADLISAQDGDVARGNHTSGMTLKESKAAALLVAMNAEIAAHDHAMAGGTISQKDREAALRAINHNYTKLLSDTLGVKNGDGGE